jgi:hypothetical protein
LFISGGGGIRYGDLTAWRASAGAAGRIETPVRALAPKRLFRLGVGRNS